MDRASLIFWLSIVWLTVISSAMLGIVFVF
jgi:hypothetical protein